MLRNASDVRLSLFGPLVLRCGSDGLPLAMTGQVLELFAFLLCFSGRDLRREAVADALWEEHSPQAVRAALNTALWRLRCILKPVAALALVSGASSIRLDVPDDAEIDARQLERSLAAGLRAHEQAHVLDPPLRQQLARAVEQCDGVFLAAVRGHWVLAERERKFNSLMRALTLLMQDCVARRDYPGALEHGQRILAADPFREKIQCEVMWLYVLDGQRPRALRHFAAYRALLRRELGIEPMPETCAVHAHAAASHAPDACMRPAADIKQLFETIEASRLTVMQAIGALAV